MPTSWARSKTPPSANAFARVTYAQGMQNQRDGLPLFGWNPKIPAKDREIMAEVARQHGYGAKSIH